MTNQSPSPTAMPQPVVVLSSGGKDSLFMIDRLRSEPGWRIHGLLTTVQVSDGRVSMHGVSAELLRAQAAALDLPLTLVDLPDGCDNREYQRRLGAALAPFADEGVGRVACGDLFLDDIRQWREASFAEQGWHPVFPIWDTSTAELARRMAGPEWEVIVTGIDASVLDEAFLGRPYNELLDRLPEGVDPCGENGEFHTFVCNGPGFRQRLSVATGKRQRHFDRYLTLEIDPI